jgi:hypothetical protein
MAPTGVPGEDLVDEGLADLSAGRVTPAALLVSMGAPRLRRLRLVVPVALSEPEHRLYRLLAARHGDAAHSRYNALVRRLVSFELRTHAGASRRRSHSTIHACARRRRERGHAGVFHGRGNGGPSGLAIEHH